MWHVNKEHSAELNMTLKIYIVITDHGHQRMIQIDTVRGKREHSFTVMTTSHPPNKSSNYALMKQKDKTGALGYSEFRGLWTILGMWKVTKN